jgi:phage terminase small subunit
MIENVLYPKLIGHLTPKQRRFVEEYMKDFQPTQAAIRAGYAPKSARSQAYRLLQRGEIRNALDEGQRKFAPKAKRLGEEALRRVKAIGFCTFADFLDAEGKLLPPKAWPKDGSLAVEKITVVVRNDDRKSATVTNIGSANKFRALMMLANHLEKHPGQEQGESKQDDATRIEEENFQMEIGVGEIFEKRGFTLIDENGEVAEFRKRANKVEPPQV